jgi:hypothetical protein
LATHHLCRRYATYLSNTITSQFSFICYMKKLNEYCTKYILLRVGCFVYLLFQVSLSHSSKQWSLLLEHLNYLKNNDTCHIVIVVDCLKARNSFHIIRILCSVTLSSPPSRNRLYFQPPESELALKLALVNRMCWKLF